MSKPTSARQYESPALDASGRIVGLQGKVKLGGQVTWLGRKQGSCSNDDKFVVGQPYSVCHIYDSNHDVEIELPDCPPHVTIRAGQSEYEIAHG